MGRFGRALLAMAALALVAPAVPAAAISPAGYAVWGIVRSPRVASQTLPAADRENAGAGAVTVTRSSKGQWLVRFTGLADAIGGSAGNYGVALTGPLGSLPTQCQVNEWGSTGADVVVAVACRDRGTGRFADRPFIVAYALSVTSTWPPLGIVSAYGWGNRPADSGPISTDYSYLPAGGAIGSTRSNVGSYSFLLGDVPAAGGTVVLSDYGTGASCTMAGWYEPEGLAGNTRVEVVCRDLAGQPVDTPVTLLRTVGGGLSPYISSPAAYLWASKAKAASYRPPALYRYNSSGQGIVVTRTGRGAYSVRVAGQTGNAAVIVTAYGNTSRACQVSTIGSASPVRIGVRCFTASGRPADSRFTLVWSQ